MLYLMNIPEQFVARRTGILLQSLFVALSAPVFAGTDDLCSKVSGMEQEVFGRTKVSRPLVERIKALEIEAFSKPAKGTLKERVEALSKAVGAGKQDAAPPVAPAFERAKDHSEPARVHPSHAGTAGAVDGGKTHSDRVTFTRERLLSGIKLYQDGKIDGAEKAFRDVLASNPYDPDACFSLGAICESRGELIAAMGFYRTAAMANPDDREAQEAVAAMEEKIALTQGPFVNPISGTPVLSARASQVGQGFSNQYAPMTPTQASLLPTFPTSYVGPRQIPTSTIGGGQPQPSPPRPRPSTGAAVARGVARVAASAALQYSGLHCPLCQLLRF